VNPPKGEENLPRPSVIVIWCKQGEISSSSAIVPYNPQQNGVTRWKNRSRATKTMIHYRDLPMFLWAKARNTAIYIQNRCPNGILEDKTPEEAFTGVKPEVSCFCLFRCPIYIHVRVEKRTKFDPSNRKHLFVCYSETSKAYKVYIPEQRKTILSRDVKYEEDIASKKSHELIPMIENEELEALKVEPRSLVTSKSIQHPSSEEGLTVVEFWYLGKWSPSVIDVSNTKGGKVPLPHFTLCYKVK
jgi:hypothetical protein